MAQIHCYPTWNISTTSPSLCLIDRLLCTIERKTGSGLAICLFVILVYSFISVMARPLRIEFAGALYHVTSRGDKRDDIYLEDTDRDSFLSALSDVCERFNLKNSVDRSILIAGS